MLKKTLNTELWRKIKINDGKVKKIKLNNRINSV